MTFPADTWGIHENHYWLRGGTAEHQVEYYEERGMWTVHGYPETLAVLNDPTTFQSDLSAAFPEGTDMSFNEGNLVQMDGLDHRKLRRLVSNAFTPKIVADLEPRIAGVTVELLDEVADQDEIELVSALAYPLPVIVIAELLGVPASDRDLFRTWVDTMFQDQAELSLADGDDQLREDLEAQLNALKPMSDYLTAHAAERRRAPREDLLTKLVQAEVDGERLNDTEIVNFAGLLLVAGHITTTMLLGNTILCLDTFPEQAERVRADRSLVPTAIEESLRMLSPFAATARVTATDVELGGKLIPRGQMVNPLLGAANRDPRQFDRPDEFDAGRDPNPHIAFGRGVHFCLGAPLARLEGRVAVNLMLDRFPVLRTIPANPPKFMDSPFMTGVSSLPLRVTA
ncbi:cytochrome P450 [Allokutzneria sp. A3M-2-11 16]|uniref:cytochrome P450 n=1 Tax=Allokutzneria sp. A3M-2-11 16 TaxID=2962043 RepID=UPI0020B6AD8C|nr:cytochrome P450 [Allokutzneria sp. A3M-2-11 16]MCP3804075.1 cytochrome P450 [Allokutzneria sp. A3M-2-11 16]